MTSVTAHDHPAPMRARRRSTAPSSRFHLHPLRALRSALLWLGAIVGAASIVIVACCMLFQLRPEVVVSGSMEPTIPVGSLVLAASTPGAELRVGDVVTVERPGGRGLVTHRVVSTEASGSGTSVVLKGDANASADPQPYVVNTAGKVVVTLPYVGYVAAAVKTPLGIATVIIYAVAVIILGFSRRRTA